MAGTATAAIFGTLIEKLTSMVSAYLLEEALLVSSFREDFDSLCRELESIKSLLKDAGGKRSSAIFSSLLEKLEDFLDDAFDIVEECGEARSWWNPIFRRRMGGKIKKLNERLRKIHVSAKYIKYAVFAYHLNAHVESQDGRQRSFANDHLIKKELPPVGMEDDIQKITDLIVKKDGRRLIAVVGMGGQGKTLLVESVFNQERVDQHFHHFKYWAVVSQKSDVEDVLKQMGKTLKREDISKEKIKELFVDLKGNRCLFVFDDVWDIGGNLFDLIQVLLQSKHNIVITSRHRKVAESFENAYIHMMSYLSEENSWKLFCMYAFPDPHHLPEELKNIDRHPILEKCGGLPLAIKTIGACMSREKWLQVDWERALGRLNDLSAMNDRVMPSLRLSYEALHDDLKACFLYFSVFPKGIEIECEKLVHMWIAQGLVSFQVAAEDKYHAGDLYIEELIDRCLIETSQVGGYVRIKSCKIHDLLHELAVSESPKRKCLLKPQEQLESFPAIDDIGLRRISLIKNNIGEINQTIKCSRLRILLLSENLSLKSISPSFLNNLTYLIVLDLSSTALSTLPKSIGKLKHLKFLNLSNTALLDMPECLSGLVRLQYLNVSHCSDLKNLHSGISRNKHMLYLNMEGCGKLKWLPKGISKLSHLQTLKGTLSGARNDAKALQLSDLKGLINLQHLALEIGRPSENIAQPEEGTFGEMKKMQSLSVINNGSSHLNLPSDMGDMDRLQVVCLRKCVIPSWIFELPNLTELDLQKDDSIGSVYKRLAFIPNLKKLHLSQNDNCIEFPVEFGECTAFPKLEELMVDSFSCLEKFPSLQDAAMPMLKYFRLRWCHKLRNIAQGLERLKSLKEVEILRNEGDPDLWEGEWLRTLIKKGIKPKVSRYDQTTIDGIDDSTTSDGIDNSTTANDNALQWWYTCCTVY